MILTYDKKEMVQIQVSGGASYNEVGFRVHISEIVQ